MVLKEVSFAPHQTWLLWPSFFWAILILFDRSDSVPAVSSSPMSPTSPILGKLYLPLRTVSVQKRTMVTGSSVSISRRVSAAAVVFLAVLMIFSDVRAGSVERSKGETWTYEMSTTVELMGLEINVSGPLTYEYVGETSVTVDGTAYSSQELLVDGSLTGTVYALGTNIGSADVAISGTQMELSGTMGILEEDLTTIASLTVGVGVISFTYHFQTETIVTNTPPILAEFDPETTHLGDSWTEDVLVNTTFKTWENGTLANTTTDVGTETFQIDVSSSTEVLEVPAGVFETTRVQVSDGTGDYDVVWWSSEANNAVVHEVHVNGSQEPSVTLTLSSHSPGSPPSALVYVALGVTVLVVASIVLVLVLMKRRPPVTPNRKPADDENAPS